MPGGLLNYAFPTKTNPFEKTYPLSNEGATLEYEVYVVLDSCSLAHRPAGP